MLLLDAAVHSGTDGSDEILQQFSGRFRALVAFTYRWSAPAIATAVLAHMIVSPFTRGSTLGTTLLWVSSGMVLPFYGFKITVVDSAAITMLSRLPSGDKRRANFGFHITRLVLGSAALAHNLLAPLLTDLLSARGGCPGFLLGEDVSPPAGVRWPAGFGGSYAISAVQDGVDVTRQLWWIHAVNVLAACIIYIVSAQAHIAAQRSRESADAAARLRSALRYISHEARSPLGGAILSLSLMHDAIDDGDRPSSKALVGDLHVSLEAAKRHLDDLLLYEKVTGSGEDSAGAWGWNIVGPATLERQTRVLRGACRAERIGLRATAAQGRLDVAGTLRGWDDETRGAPSSERAAGAEAAAGPRMAEAAAARESRWEVFANWQRLDAIVQNALSNSIKHAPGGGRGRIAVSVSVLRPSDAPQIGPPTRSPDASVPKPAAVVSSAPPAVEPGRTPGRVHPWASTRLAEPRDSGGAAALARPPSLGSTASLKPAVSPSWERRVLAVEVLDNGLGIPAELLEPGRLFHPFQQLRMGDSALRMTSSGLGLSIVKSIVVDQMAGEVGLASREGSGTLFFALAPVWARQVRPDAGEAAAGERLREGMPDDGKGGAATGIGSDHIGAVTIRGGGRLRLHSQPVGIWTLSASPRGAGADSNEQGMTVLVGGERHGSAAPASARGSHKYGASEPMADGRSSRDAMRHARSRSPSHSSAGSVRSAGSSRSRAEREARRGLRQAQRSAASVHRRHGTTRRHGLPADEGADITEKASHDAAAQVGPSLRRGDVAGVGCRSSPCDGQPSHASRLADARRAGGMSAREAARHSALDAEPAGSRLPPLRSPIRAPAHSAFVVDDERVNRTLMARVVRRWGLHATEIDDGQGLLDALEGIAAAAEGAAHPPRWPAFVTLDMQMPVVGGCEALEGMAAIAARLEEQGRPEAAAGLRGIVVLGVTGNAVSEDRERMTRLGARRVLTKPVHPSVVAEAVREFLPHVALPERAFRGPSG